jgi:hypothetical protein
MEYDASRVGIEAFFIQDGRSISYRSKVLKVREVNLSTYDKQLLTI